MVFTAIACLCVVISDALSLSLIFGHLGGWPRAFRPSPLSDDQSCDV